MSKHNPDMEQLRAEFQEMIDNLRYELGDKLDDKTFMTGGGGGIDDA